MLSSFWSSTIKTNKTSHTVRFHIFIRQYEDTSKQINDNRQFWYTLPALILIITQDNEKIHYKKRNETFIEGLNRTSTHKTMKLTLL